MKRTIKNIDDFLKEVSDFAYSEVARTSMPVKLHVDLSKDIGKNLAKRLGANIKIVEAGTLLMDCMIGQAMIENRLPDHITMSLEKANDFLDRSELNESEKENIRHCVLEHHGSSKYFSLESEICANADCYRFASINGFIYALRFLRDMPIQDLITLAKNKANEKWKVISLPSVREELEPQYHAIMKILDGFEIK